MSNVGEKKFHKTVWVAIGIPASGKTTFFTEDHSYRPLNTSMIVSSDKIRESLLGNTTLQANQNVVWKEFFNQIDLFMKDPKMEHCYLDSTCARKRDRVNLLTRVNTYKAILREKNTVLSVLGVYFNLPLKDALFRNSKRDRVVPEIVIERMDRLLKSNPPKLLDGFDEIDKFYF